MKKTLLILGLVLLSVLAISMVSAATSKGKGDCGPYAEWNAFDERCVCKTDTAFGGLSEATAGIFGGCEGSMSFWNGLLASLSGTAGLA